MGKYTRIQQAIFSDNVGELKDVLQEVACGSVSLLDHQCRIPLLGLAIKHQCSIDIVKELIDNRCLVNEGINHESLSIDINPLVLACKNKNYQAMELLIKAGGIVEVRDCIGNPLIHIACRHDLRFVKLLVENGADPHTVSRHANTVLHAAVYNMAPFGIFHYLLKCGVDPTEKNSSGQTPLDIMASGAVKCDSVVEVMMKMAVEQRVVTHGSLSSMNKINLEVNNSPLAKAMADLEKDSKKAKGIDQSVVSAYNTLRTSQRKRRECVLKSMVSNKKLVGCIDTETKTFGTPLECPVCFIDFKGNVILQCRNGHVLCFVCHQKFKVCPQCRVSLHQKRRIRNRVLESIVRGINSDRLS